MHNQSFIHRDIKLENIMIRPLSKNKAIIIDLGLASYLEDLGLGFIHAGTLGYMAPEILKYN